MRSDHADGLVRKDDHEELEWLVLEECVGEVVVVEDEEDEGSSSGGGGAIVVTNLLSASLWVPDRVTGAIGFGSCILLSQNCSDIHFPSDMKMEWKVRCDIRVCIPQI